MSRKPNVLAIFMVVLTIGIIIIGILFMPSVLLDYKDSITAFPKSEQNRMLYVEQSGELVLSPWDTFNPDDCEMLNRLDAQEKVYAVELLMVWIFETNTPDDTDHFLPPVYFDQKQNTYYIKDYEYRNINGETCILNFAAREDLPVYLDCHLKNDIQTDIDIGELNEKLKALVKESMVADYMKIVEGIEVYNQDPSAEIDVYKQKYDVIQNPIDRYFSNLLEQSYDSLDQFYVKSIYQLIEQVAFAIQHAEHTTAISYNDQILLVLSGESTAILFYDPAHDEITGFSIKS